MLVRKSLQRTISRLLIAHQIINTHLVKRDLFTATFVLFNAVDGANHLLIIFLSFVELHQNIENITARAIALGQFFIGRDGLIEILSIDIRDGKTLHIRVICRIQASCFGNIDQG